MLFCKVIDSPPASADNLVGLDEEPWRNGEAQSLSGLQIDDQLERGGLLHGEVRRLRPVQDLIEQRFAEAFEES